MEILENTRKDALKFINALSRAPHWLYGAFESLNSRVSSYFVVALKRPKQTPQTERGLNIFEVLSSQERIKVLDGD